MPWVSVTPRVEETDLYDDEILVKGRRWGGLSEFQDPTLCFLLGTKGTKQTYQISEGVMDWPLFLTVICVLGVLG